MKNGIEHIDCTEESSCDHFFISTYENQFLFIPVNNDEMKKLKYLSDRFSLIKNKKPYDISNESKNILKTREA